MSDYYIPIWGIGIGKAIYQTQLVLGGRALEEACIRASSVKDVLSTFEGMRDQFTTDEFAKRWQMLDNMHSDAICGVQVVAGQASMTLRYALAYGYLDAFTFDPTRTVGGSEVCCPDGAEWLEQYKHDQLAARSNDRVSPDGIAGPGLFRLGIWQRVWLRKEDFNAWLEAQRKPGFLASLLNSAPPAVAIEDKAIPDRIDLSAYRRFPQKIEALIFTVYGGRPPKGKFHPEIVADIKPLALRSGYRWKSDKAVRQQVKDVFEEWIEQDRATNRAVDSAETEEEAGYSSEEDGVSHAGKAG